MRPIAKPNRINRFLLTMLPPENPKPRPAQNNERLLPRGVALTAGGRARHSLSRHIIHTLETLQSFPSAIPRLRFHCRQAGSRDGTVAKFRVRRDQGGMSDQAVGMIDCGRNFLWKPTLIGQCGKPCWLSRLSILCGDPHILQFVLASAKFRRFFWRRCVS